MKFIVFFALFASAYAGVVNQGIAQQSVAVAAPAYGAPAVHAAPAVASAPQQYSQAIQAAAIRNVETVGVTKTITPVVTKTTTHRHHSEPAVSVGYVQGYTQSAQGAPQVVPVQYNTQYTQYVNPTVGLNGPVTYAGPAHQTGIAVAAKAVAPVATYAAAAPAIASYAAPAYAAPAYAGHAVGLQAAYAPAVASYAAGGLYSVQPAYAAAIPSALSFQPQVHAIGAYASPAVASYGKY